MQIYTVLNLHYNTTSVLSPLYSAAAVLTVITMILTLPSHKVITVLTPTVSNLLTPIAGTRE